MKNSTAKKASVTSQKRSKSEEAFKKDFLEQSAQSEISRLPIATLDRVIHFHYKNLKQIKKTPYWVNVAPVDQIVAGKEDVIGNTCIDVIAQDMAFIVDSITAELVAQGLDAVFLIHPLIEQKSLVKGSSHHAHLHVRVSNLLPLDECEKLKNALENILSDIVLATSDFMMMKNVVRHCQKGLNNAPSDTYPEELLEDNLEFLEYLHRGSFTFLGYREYKYKRQKNGHMKSVLVRDSSLGLLKNERAPIFLNNKDISLPERLQDLRVDLPPVYVSKLNKLSTVHRKVPLDCINIKLFDVNGALVGEGCFIGLFTSVTYNQSLQAVPFLRYKADQVVQQSGFVHGAHDYRVLRHILEKYPRDELFQIDVKQLVEFSKKLIKLQDYKRVALFLRNDPFERFVSCLVYVPKERWDTRLRYKFKSILEENLQGKTIDFTLSIDDSPLARLSFVIAVEPFKLVEYNQSAIEQELREAAQKWIDHLQTVVYEETKSNKRAFEIVQKYQDAFTGGYQNRYSAQESYRDILKIEEALSGQCLALDLLQNETICEDIEGVCHLDLKFYHCDQPIDLSSVIPIVENMGFYVVSEIPSEVRMPDGQHLWIQHFKLRSNGLVIDSKEFAKRKPLFEESFLDIYKGDTENDLLNQLTLKEGISSRDVVILRTILRYLRQTNYAYSKTFSEQVVTQNSEIARLVINLFKAQHDPSFNGVRETKCKKISRDLVKAFEAVKSIDHDSIMRLFWNVTEATLRTNFFQSLENGNFKDSVSIKLDSSLVPSLPDPKPYREIFVYSRRVEGIHLRGDVISRGGLRWSDRHEDFRTEVLGLMKAQMVKNAVIVPMGAKGGFVVKNPPQSGDRQAFLDEGIACYKIFISGLLDITDNIQGQEVVPPQNVVRRDGDDPYLVVAADKGTATFSDIANGISEERGFWLGDAFASGGSAGYDHKVMGITARGAWESVKRHFRELGHDSQAKDFDVVGVGDMGGDVFGNGMLLSKHIRLVGAFNHLHIFCDPDPDAATSWKERKRLFTAVKGWDQYNEKLLSKGGRIYSRHDKKLKLTKQIKERFGIEADEVSPNQLMKAMLKSEIDLLWFGGIGTYIKAKSESHADASDKANDAIRVDAREVNARVIGEGANLGVTQLARVQLADRSVRVNADFIDNAGGVNSSDVEVNIKILLNQLVREKKSSLSLDTRNTLLTSMTADVEELVLSNNYQQAQAISLMVYNAPSTLLNQAEYIRNLEARGLLDREIEFLPNDEEIEDRLKDGEGLHRPELSVLQCYAKNTLTKDILETNIPDHPLTEEILLGYFPPVLIKKYKKEILNHQLKKEIVATELANIIVNRFGPTFISSVMANTGASIQTIFKAFFVIAHAFDLRSLWDRIEALDGKVDADIQIKAFSDIAKIVERQVVWLTKRMGAKIDPVEQAPIFRKAVEALRKDLTSILPESRRSRLCDVISMYSDNNFPDDVARDIAYMSPMSAVGNIIIISSQRKIPIKDMAHVYYVIGEYFHIYWLRLQSRHLFAAGLWSGQALREIRSKLYICQARIAERYIAEYQSKGLRISASDIEEWTKRESVPAEQALSTIRSMRDSQKIDLSMLIVAEQMLSALYEG